LARILGVSKVPASGEKQVQAQVLLAAGRRVVITKMVTGTPLTVEVEPLEDEPFDPNDKELRALCLETAAALREIGRHFPHAFFADYLVNFLNQLDLNNPKELADLGTSFTTR
jgi:hypothetical protein